MLIIHIFIYLALLSLIIYVSLYINPRMWIHRMPPEVRQKISDRSRKEQHWFIVFGIPLACIMIFYPAVYTYISGTGLAGCAGTLMLFYGGFTVWDTLVLDLLIFAGITPEFIIIEGTEKKDYKNKHYHLRSGIKGLIFAVSASIIISTAIHFIT